MKSFVLTPSADRDLNQIWDYVAQDSIRMADRVLLGLKKALRHLAKNPGIGHYRRELADEQYRFFLVYSYLIVYRPGTQPLQIVRVLHAARDIYSLLNASP